MYGKYLTALNHDLNNWAPAFKWTVAEEEEEGEEIVVERWEIGAR